MGQSLQVISDTMGTSVMPRLSMILRATPDIDARAFHNAFIESLNANPKLLNCSQSTMFLAATTLGCLGVYPGPFLGQGWLIPRKLKGVWSVCAQLGYKGLNTIAGRGGRTIETDVIRKLDRNITIRKGTEPHVSWDQNIDEAGSAIIAAFSAQEFQGRRVSPMVIPLAEITAIRDKNSKAAGKDDEEDTGFSPWNDPKVGFPAMCQKTAALRQRRTLPFGIFHFAGAMDDLQEMGRGAWIEPDDAGHMKIVTDNKDEIIVPDKPTGDAGPLPTQLEKPDFTIMRGKNAPLVYQNVEDYKNAFMRMVKQAPPTIMGEIRKVNGDAMFKLSEQGYGREINEISLAITQREADKA